MKMPHRDSWVWAFGIVCSLIVALAANLPLFPWLPDDVKHALSLASFLIGVWSGKMAHSPQPSREARHREQVVDDVVNTLRGK